MKLQVKICGLTDAVAVAAVNQGGARYAGFVFYAKSPRYLNADAAAMLIGQLAPEIIPVGLFVDADDAYISHILSRAPLQALQLHGNETPGRIGDLKQKTSLKMIKAIGIDGFQDIISAHSFEPVADMLLLDSKAPPESATPGGNAHAFDWDILKNAHFSKPWMLAGGLTSDTLAKAAKSTGAHILDVSSGVEDAPGRKSPTKIKAFLNTAHEIEISY